MHHYRVIHSDDGLSAQAGHHVPSVATLKTLHELTSVQAQVALMQFTRDYDASFPVLMVDSIGIPVATDSRNWAHRLGRFSQTA